MKKAWMIAILSLVVFPLSSAMAADKPIKLIFSKVYNRQIDSIATALRTFGKVRTESDAEESIESPGIAFEA